MRSIKSFLIKHKNGVTFFLLILVSLILLLATAQTIELQPKKIGQGIISVFQRTASSVATWFANTVNSIGELKRTKEELEDYKEKLLVYERISRESMQLRQEIQQLRELLGFSQEIGYQHIPAEVIARQPGNAFALIVLDKGLKDGVRRYMPVAAQSSGLTGLVGKVITVSRNSCTVLPILNEDSYVAARLERTRYEGIVKGESEFSDFLTMQNVQKIAIRDVQYGDMVVTSGLGQLFPKGIPTGRIRSITSDATETSIELKLEPIIDFVRLEHVLILDTRE